jgi:phosphate-selective porin
LASAPSSTTNNFAQLRDLYFDVALDAKKEYRLRIGQSKIPFGFENLQSSQNRLPLDRADPTNSAVANERDLGVVFYYAPAKTRELFAKLVSDGLKGSGDYGVLGLGAYNGQTANKTESNNTPHVVARLAYPFELKNGQIMELGIQGYKGKYNLNADLRNVGVKLPSTAEFLDERVAATFIIYPKPYGIFAEFNTGNGPEFDKASDSIQVKKLTGGYIMATYRAVVGNQGQVLMPYIRYQWYRGGKKQEMDARSYQLEEWEMGIEWQVYKNFELTAAYTISERRFEDFKVQENLQRGSLLRLQAQLNF